MKLRQRAEPRAIDQAGTGGESAAPGEIARGGEWAARGGHRTGGSERAAPGEHSPGTPPLELRLGDFLIARGMVTSAQVDEALQLQKGTGIRLGEMLVNMGFVGERGLIEALADRLHMPVSDLRSENPDPAALALIPEAVARESLAVPVSLTGDVLRVAVAEPTPEVHRLLTETSGRVVELMLSPLSDIRRTIDSSYRALGGVDKLVEAFQAVETLRKRASDMEDLEVVGNEAPVVQIVNRILTQALRDRASDVHIESQDERGARSVIASTAPSRTN